MVSADLAAAIAECLALHAEALAKLGTDMPEQLPDIPEVLRTKMCQARANVNATLEGSNPEQHVLHVKALNKGLRIILRRLAPSPPEPPPPPLPVWDDIAKAWRVPATDSKTRIAELAAAFDRRTPDDPNGAAPVSSGQVA